MASLKCVVQVGFAGARHFAPDDVQPERRRELEKKVAVLIGEELAQLPMTLGLGEEHFLCGFSQLAVGGDLAFTLACGGVPGMVQRIFLPQHRKEFFEARANDGTPDFSTEDRKWAEELLDGRPHVIGDRMVALSNDRNERFEEVNTLIARSSDVVICLSVEGMIRDRGGTADLRDRARNKGVPVLDLTVAEDAEGIAHITRRIWHGLERFQRPSLPRELANVHATQQGVPRIAAYCADIKRGIGSAAERERNLFRRIAWAIIGAHVLASAIAIGMLAFERLGIGPLHTELIVAEVTLLITGLLTHWGLHHSKIAARWAFSRLLAEMLRGIGSMQGMRVPLMHLFQLRLPARSKHLLRTLNILYLRTVDSSAGEELAAIRTRYAERLKAQIEYYAAGALQKARWTLLLSISFYAFSLMTISMAVIKTKFHFEAIEFAVAFGPIVAVALLSFLGSMDHEANAAEYAETKARAQTLLDQVRNVETLNELENIALESEHLLLGENAAWYTRRHAKGVA